METVDFPDIEPVYELKKLAEELGITYRRVDYYVREGYIKCDNPRPGSGSGPRHNRILVEREVEVLKLMCRFVDAVGMMPASAALLARRMVFEQSLTTTLPGGITITLEDPDNGSDEAEGVQGDSEGGRTSKEV